MHLSTSTQLAAAFLCVGLCACVMPDGKSRPVDGYRDIFHQKEFAHVREGDPYAIVRVFFGTDRRPTASKDHYNAYSGARGFLHYGWCDVSIPASHEQGQLEGPWVWGTWDPAKHIALLTLQRDDAKAFEGIRKRIGESTEKDLLIMVHGYNVTFAEAIRRGAQVVWDLKFKGVPFVYSWPSEGNVRNYVADETDARWTQQNFAKCLTDVAKNSSAKRIHILAHSMGSRVVCNALKDMVLRKTAPKVSQVILAAADIDTSVFERDLAPVLRTTCDGLTLYVTKGDKALKASESLHHYPRVGQGGESIVVIGKVDTVDVIQRDLGVFSFQHSYFAVLADVIMDIGQIVKQGLRAADRRKLIRGDKNGFPFWILP